MAEQGGQDVVGRVLDAVGDLHTEVLQLFGELRTLRAETQGLHGELRAMRERTQETLAACGEIRDGQRALEAQGALQADALRLVASVVHRIAGALGVRGEPPEGVPQG